jgi:hypothetical protein
MVMAQLEASASLGLGLGVQAAEASVGYAPRGAKGPGRGRAAGYDSADTGGAIFNVLVYLKYVNFLEIPSLLIMEMGGGGLRLPRSRAATTLRVVLLDSMHLHPLLLEPSALQNHKERDHRQLPQRKRARAIAMAARCRDIAGGRSQGMPKLVLLHCVLLLLQPAAAGGGDRARRASASRKSGRTRSTSPRVSGVVWKFLGELRLTMCGSGRSGGCGMRAGECVKSCMWGASLDSLCIGGMQKRYLFDVLHVGRFPRQFGHTSHEKRCLCYLRRRGMGRQAAAGGGRRLSALGAGAALPAALGARGGEGIFP